MRVWIVSVGEPLPTDGKNTRLRRMGNLSDCIAQEGHMVDWFSVSFDHYKKIQRCKNNEDIQIDDNFTMHLVYTNGYKKNVSLSRVIHHIVAGRKINQKMNSIKKPDIIIASMEPLEVSAVVTKYGIKNNVPVVIDIRDLWPEIYYQVLPYYLHFMITPYIQLCRLKLRKTMSMAYSIIGLSDEFLNYGLRFAGREKKALDRVFPIAYPNYNYNKYKQDFRKYWSKYGVEADDFLIVFFGNFGKQFNFQSIIEASSLLKDNRKIKFVLCGTGLQLEDVKNRVSDNVIFPGWIEKEQILSLAANASLGIAPYIDSINYTHNTPNKFGEYLSASLPILVSVSGSMENLLSKNQCGFRYNSSSKLADIINNYFDDKDKLIKHSKNARKLYEQQFNGDIVYKKILDYLIEVKNLYAENRGKAHENLQ
jgi:glycosyltransferase involved in cell wall biosynthesis